jgi:hypothetical protein
LTNLFGNVGFFQGGNTDRVDIYSRHCKSLQ